MSKKQELTPEQILQQSIYYNAFNDAINAVLEIIDKEAEKLQLGGYGKVVGTFYYEEIKRAVLALKGGEQE